MTREEQNVFLNEEYTEAIRYMDNAKETLERTRKDGNHYIDKKYVRTACGTAYLGVLIAIDAWLKIKDVDLPSKKKQKSIEIYKESIAKLDGKMVSRLNTVYDILHLAGYYWGETNVKAISGGFEDAYEIIDKIKPENPVEVKESKSYAIKRMFDKLLISIVVMFR
ncbi:MAG: DUF5618 family protein [Chitinivibrionia bacterium]|nr:DUF5618 family protein [Chitinivibrionia bacterium]MCL1946822.1 DUF5618 family protein [Chitinivibrionia bacterium]